MLHLFYFPLNDYIKNDLQLYASRGILNLQSDDPTAVSENT